MSIIGMLIILCGSKLELTKEMKNGGTVNMTLNFKYLVNGALATIVGIQMGDTGRRLWGSQPV